MLPKIAAPVYDLTLPISKQNIKFRPYLVREQKILMIAAQSDENVFIKDNIKQIIKNCCLSDINIDDLSSLDIEYFFLNLRARSIGEIVEAKYRCENKVGVDEDGDDIVCRNLMPVNIDLLSINVKFNDDFTDIVQLTDKVGIKLKYPNFSVLEKVNSEKNVVDKTLNAIIECIDYIFDEDNFYYAKETPKKELIDFIESLNVDQFKKIEEFFNNLPKLREEVNITCDKCGFEHKIVLEGIENFLA